jgi:hypothetical protein
LHVCRKNIQVTADVGVQKKTTKEKSNISKKQGNSYSKLQKQAAVADDCDELDGMQIIDFDKLIGELKFEKKMVEICIGRKSHGSKEEEVCLNAATITLLLLLSFLYLILHT